MMKDYLVLVNAEHPLRVQMDKTDLVCAFDDHPGVLLERTAAKALRALLTDIGNRDSIVPVSGWRSREEQKKIWEDACCCNRLTFNKSWRLWWIDGKHHAGYDSKYAKYYDFCHRRKS